MNNDLVYECKALSTSDSCSDEDGCWSDTDNPYQIELTLIDNIKYKIGINDKNNFAQEKIFIYDNTRYHLLNKKECLKENKTFSVINDLKFIYK